VIIYDEQLFLHVNGWNTVRCASRILERSRQPIRAAAAKEVKVKNPAEKTTARPNQISKSKPSTSYNYFSCKSVKLEATRAQWGKRPTKELLLQSRRIAPPAPRA
jgi:hypothetical protein